MEFSGIAAPAWNSVFHELLLSYQEVLRPRPQGLTPQLRDFWEIMSLLATVMSFKAILLSIFDIIRSSWFGWAHHGAQL